MTGRLPRADYERSKGAGNRRKLHALVRAGRIPNLIGYAGGSPVAWISVEPLEVFAGLARARKAGSVTRGKVWSVTCFLTAPEHRGRGLSVPMLEAAVRHAKRHGASIVEGYPVRNRSGKMPPVFAWKGLPGTFLAAGFQEVARAPGQGRGSPIWQMEV